MSYIDEKAYVLSHTDRRTLLEQLAEEAAELSQAALKLIRAEGLSDNPTPTNVSIASEQLNEEFADVLMAADAVDIPILESCDNSKWHRWASRIREERERKKKMIIHLKVNDVSDMKINITDQMYCDMTECRKLLDEERREIKDCKKCSWNNIRFGNQDFCIMDEVVSAVLGKKDICNGCFGAAGGDCDECERKEGIKGSKKD